MKRVKKSSINDSENPSPKKQKSEVKSDFFNDNFIFELEDPVAEQLSVGANFSKTPLKSDLFEESAVTLNSTGVNIVSS